MTQQNSDRINQAMNTIETEQRWVTPVEIAGVRQAGSSYMVKLAWVIKDYPGSAPVTFHYRRQGDQAFTVLEPAAAGDGRFEVELTDNMKTEPIWEVHTTYVGDGNSSSKPIRAEAKTAERPQTIEYYISVKDGTHLKSSEIASLGLEKLSWGMYGLVSAEVQVDQTHEYYSVSLIQSAIEPTQVKLSRAFLDVYRGNELLSQNELTEDQAKPDQSVLNTQWNYHGLTFDRMYLTLEYANGKQFKKELPSAP